MTSTELVRTACCGSHQPGPMRADGMAACCDPDDCGPCCPDCPTCPTLQRQRGLPNRRDPENAAVRVIYATLQRGERDVVPAILGFEPRHAEREELVVRAREVMRSLIEADLLVRRRPRAGDRVVNGGHPGVQPAPVTPEREGPPSAWMRNQ